ncbi:low molecular weight phosphotyrosine protein phosphatase 2 [Scaptodrosophila lebanonensis]|uniref:Low molecular weight phosphotyrosine protein phosphatase n=1 Tax=Drosophila lebanonensis TaxID=7225 RepID=A0A6J2T8V0_DROLE|nr:low molecular weight phosphotyrosine protein phosphatase 2 [Scaptodrosophila lebanonensis]
MSKKFPNRILMVCMGNICRSPIAEAVMRATIEKADLSHEWYVDSAGIEGWHSGCEADPRTLNVLANHNIKYNNRARVLLLQDFEQYDYIFGMDQSNMASLKRMAPQDCKAKLLLLGDFGLKPDDRIIEDPYYYVGEAPFEKIYEQCIIACPNFLKQARSSQIRL